MRKSEVEELNNKLIAGRKRVEEAIELLKSGCDELEKILKKVASDKRFMEMNNSGELRCRNNTVARPYEFALNTLDVIKKKGVVEDMNELSAGYLCILLGILTYKDTMPKKRFGIF